MIYLSGKIRENLHLRPDMGWMLTPASGRRATFGAPWAADNSCFSQGDRFRPAHFLTWLEAMDEQRDTCLFAVAPDVVGDAAATLRRSQPFFLPIHAAGYNVAFVAQDRQETLPLPWDDFECLFIGGTTGWKLSEPAFALAAEAKARGKWTHMGRVNSRIRLRASAAAGFDSADGTFITYRPDVYSRRIARWLGEIERQPGLAVRA